MTGTNGKTLTTALTVGILQEAFGEITTNTSGQYDYRDYSHLLSAKKNKNGKKIAVLEIDEASLARVTDFIKPSLIVFTNIFRDQMDRYGEIYTTYQMILDGPRHLRQPFSPTVIARFSTRPPLPIQLNTTVLRRKSMSHVWPITIPKAFSAHIATRLSSTSSIPTLTWATSVTTVALADLSWITS